MPSHAARLLAALLTKAGATLLLWLSCWLYTSWGLGISTGATLALLCETFTQQLVAAFLLQIKFLVLLAQGRDGVIGTGTGALLHIEAGI